MMMKKIEEFKPKRNISESYSLEYLAKSRGLTVEELKKEIDAEIQLRERMIQERLDKGYTYEEARNETLRCMYIPGFYGPTFRD